MSPSVRALQLAAAALLPAALYAPRLGRPFVSEDYLILRRLTEAPAWDVAWAQLTGPWLGTTVVELYRPVASWLLLGLLSVFGASPLALGAVQVALHGLNAALLFLAVERMLASPPADSIEARSAAQLPFLVALLFGLYPLSPNTVLFAAAFVNLYGAAFALGAVVTFLGFRARSPVGEAGRWPVLSAVLFALALGCYEATAVLPAILLGLDLLLPGPDPVPPLRRRLTAHAPFAALLGAYLLVRLLLFGSLLGGYEDTAARLGRVRELASGLVASFFRMVHPVYGPDRWEPPLALASGVLLLIVGLSAMARRRPTLRAPAGLLLAALLWVALAQAPFGFPSVVPGNGRYWYLAAAGLAVALPAAAWLMAAGLAAAGLRLGTRATRLLVVGVTAALGLHWLVLLAPNLGRYEEAGRLAAAIREETVRAAASWSPESPFFVSRYPAFVETAGGVPAAQVYTWGLRDAVNPPFAARPHRLYPLPPLGDGALLPVARSRHGERVLVWEAEAETWKRFAVTPRLEAFAANLAEIAVESPADGATLSGDGTDWRIVLAGTPGDSGAIPTTLFVVGAGNAFRQPLAEPGALDERIRAGSHSIQLPAEFLRAQRDLYGTRENGVALYWWLEARDSKGRLAGFSPLRRLSLPAGTAARP